MYISAALELSTTTAMATKSGISLYIIIAIIVIVILLCAIFYITKYCKSKENQRPLTPDPEDPNKPLINPDNNTDKSSKPDNPGQLDGSSENPDQNGGSTLFNT